ncbi:hypothetical protein [Haloarchaeobius amylolyticus]|uniref:hypothetical protein n=1 Tax=Haloarchaeobius amylolyticus TaxID=1198296 RepID=UPI00226FACFA|nr:hypothetical protein [Haloarchaeobius amylolyticus]
MSERSSDQFLRVGALVGTIGWTVTQVAAWLGAGALPVLVLWVGLLGAMTVVGLARTPPTVRFSTPLLVWGATNGTATVWTVAAVLGAPVPATALAGWLPWLGSFTVAYAATAWFVPAARLVYGAASLSAAGLAVALLALPALAPVTYLLVGAVHVVPLVVATR